MKMEARYVDLQVTQNNGVDPKKEGLEAILLCNLEVQAG